MNLAKANYGDGEQLVLLIENRAVLKGTPRLTELQSGHVARWSIAGLLDLEKQVS